MSVVRAIFLLVVLSINHRGIAAQAKHSGEEHGVDERRAELLEKEQALFLRGCKGDLACAATKHKKLLDFREKHPSVYSNLTSGSIGDMIRSGAVLLDESTCSGHAVFLVRNRLFDWDRSRLELLQWQVYNHEVLFHYAPASERGIVVVQDVSGFALGNMWAIARSGGLGLLDYFDQNIVGIVLIGEPWFFGSFWKIARMLLPEKERNMIKMLGSNWNQLPQAVQMGGACSGGELGDAEKRLLQLPTDEDLGGTRLGTLPLEIPRPLSLDGKWSGHGEF